MKILLFVILLVVIAMLIVIPLYNVEFNTYIKKNWPSQLLFFFGIVLTIFAAYTIYSYEKERYFQSQVEEFNSVFAAHMIELADNQSVLNKLIQSFEQTPMTQFNLMGLKFNSLSPVSKNEIIKYTGKEYFILLNTYETQLRILERMLNMSYDIFARTGSVPDSLRTDVLAKIRDSLWYTYLLQCDGQYYAFGVGANAGPSSPIASQVMEWAKNRGEAPSISELREKIVEISNISLKDRKRINKEYMKIIRRQRR